MNKRDQKTFVPRVYDYCGFHARKMHLRLKFIKTRKMNAADIFHILYQLTQIQGTSLRLPQSFHKKNPTH